MSTIGSILLGLLGWILPFLGEYDDVRAAALRCLGSMSACLLSIGLQLIDMYRGKVDLLDVYPTLAMVITLLSVSTIVVNAIALWLNRRRRKERENRYE